MRFQLDPAFNSKMAKVTVTYLDKGTGVWSLGVSGKDGTRIENGNSGEWKTKTVILPDVSEIVLNYESGEDTVFHLIEVEKTS